MITREFPAHIKRVDSTDMNVEIKVTLSYDAGTDPFAVQAVFTLPEGVDRVWHFSRDLMLKGCRSITPYGEGDVKFRCFPSQSILLMCLRSSGNGPQEATHADVALPLTEVAEFLQGTAEAAAVTEQECDALIDEFLKELFEA